MIVISEFEINQVAAPNLPLSPMEYNRQYNDQLNNVLRLYFNRVDAILNQLKTDEIIPALTNYTVATLPSAVTSGKGARSFVTDALPHIRHLQIRFLFSCHCWRFSISRSVPWTGRF